MFISGDRKKKFNYIYKIALTQKRISRSSTRRCRLMINLCHSNGPSINCNIIKRCTCMGLNLIKKDVRIWSPILLQFITYLRSIKTTLGCDIVLVIRHHSHTKIAILDWNIWFVYKMCWSNIDTKRIWSESKLVQFIKIEIDSKQK